MSRADAALLEVRSVEKRFGGLTALTDVTVFYLDHYRYQSFLYAFPDVMMLMMSDLVTRWEQVESALGAATFIRLMGPTGTSLATDTDDGYAGSCSLISPSALRPVTA